MPILGLIFFSLALGAQEPSRVSTIIDISNLRMAEKTAVLSYETQLERRRQVRLRNVTLTLAGQNFYPKVNISAYLDELSGTAICRAFGFGRGVLGASLSAKGFNTFSMNAAGMVDDIDHYDVGGTETRITGEVICSVPDSVQ